MNSVEAELLPTRLYRAAQGNRAHEAAIVLLTTAGLLDQLSCCITHDIDQDLAWIDWPGVTTMADRATNAARAILVLASTIATEGHHLTPNDYQALRLTVEHLSTQREHGG